MKTVFLTALLFLVTLTAAQEQTQTLHPDAIPQPAAPTTPTTSKPKRCQHIANKIRFLQHAKTTTKAEYGTWRGKLNHVHAQLKIAKDNVFKIWFQTCFLVA